VQTKYFSVSIEVDRNEICPFQANKPLFTLQCWKFVVMLIDHLIPWILKYYTTGARPIQSSLTDSSFVESILYVGFTDSGCQFEVVQQTN